MTTVYKPPPAWLPPAWTAFEREYRWRGIPMFVSQGVLLGLYLVWQRSLALPVGAPWGVLAIAISAVGLAARLWGTGILSAGTMVSMSAQTDRLVTRGIFQLVRNPLYLGDILIFTGYGLLLEPWLALPFGVYHIVRSLRLIAYEEVRLRARWGSAYEEYCRTVPRLIPRMFRVDSGAVNWRDSVQGSAIWIGFVGGYVAAVVSRDLWVLTPFETAGFLYAAYHFSRKATSAPASELPDASSVN